MTATPPVSPGSGISFLTERPAWQALERHCHVVRDVHLRTLFADDPTRGERLTAEAAGLYLDYSKNRITDDTLRFLLQRAEQSGLRAAYDPWREKGRMENYAHLAEAVDHGAVQRIRPKMRAACSAFRRWVTIATAETTATRATRQRKRRKRRPGLHPTRAKPASRDGLACRTPLGGDARAPYGRPKCPPGAPRPPAVVGIDWQAALVSLTLQALLKNANVGQDAGVVDANDRKAFIAAAKTRQWDRENDRTGNLVAIQLRKTKRVVHG